MVMLSALRIGRGKGEKIRWCGIGRGFAIPRRLPLRVLDVYVRDATVLLGIRRHLRLTINSSARVSVWVLLYRSRSQPCGESERTQDVRSRSSGDKVSSAKKKTRGLRGACYQRKFTLDWLSNKIESISVELCKIWTKYGWLDKRRFKMKGLINRHLLINNKNSDNLSQLQRMTISSWKHVDADNL